MGALRIASALAGIALFTACAVDPALRRGDELSQRGLWRDAAAAYAEALERRPEDTGLQARLAHSRVNAAENAARSAEAAIAADQLGEAEALLRDALELDPECAPARLRMVELGERLAAGARAELEAGEPGRALALAEHALELAPEAEAVREVHETVLLAEIERLWQDAANHETQGRPGAALVAMLRISELSPSWRNVGDRLASLRRAVRQRSAYLVELRRLAGSGPAARIAKALEARIRGANRPSGCPNLHVVETALEGPGLSVRGRIAAVRHDQRTRRSEQRTFQSGTREIPNPARPDAEAAEATATAALRAAVDEVKALMDEVREKEILLVEAPPDADVAALRRDLEVAQSTLSGAKRAAKATQETALAARRRLKETPVTIDEPVMAEVELQIFDVERVLDVALNLDARDLTTGEPAWKGLPFSTSARSADTTHRGVPKAGIDPDPLVFPKSDEVLEGEALGALEKHILEAVIAQCGRQQQGLREAARALDAQGDLAGATDWLVQSLFYASDPKLDEATRFLTERWKLRDPLAVLRE